MGHDAGWASERYHSSYRLREDDTGEVLHDKLRFIFLELARFKKRDNELVDYYDKWMYLLKNMSTLKERPEIFDEKEFDRLFEQAELRNFTPEEYREYQDSQNMIYDYENTIDFARQEGLKQGRAEGREEGRKEGGMAKAFEIAKKMKTDGLSMDLIMTYSGLSEDELASL